MHSVDPFYPPVGETVWQSESVDVCLAHPQSGLLYHYHTGEALVHASHDIRRSDLLASSTIMVHISSHPAVVGQG